jgi:uncharacterized protein (DUF2147 family)
VIFGAFIRIFNPFPLNNMTVKPFLWAAFLVLFAAFQSIAQTEADGALGVWYSEGKESKIEIYKKGDRYFGKVAWVSRKNADGSPVLDVNNPDVKLRSRPITGIVLMHDFKHAGKNVWEDGKIYDPKNGKTYSCKMTLISKNQLNVRGYVGISLMGRTTTWTRAE